MRPISLITAVILPLAFAAPVPGKDTSSQVVPTPQALIDAGLGQFATPADIAYINSAIAAAEAAAAATQKAGGSSKRQDLGLGSLTGALDPILGILGSLGLGGLKERDEIVKRQSLPVLGNVVGSVPGIATGTGITNNLPIVGPIVGGILQNPTSVVTSVLGGGLKEKAKRRQEVAAAVKE
ncbi:hypothetical protein BOTNAR_0008g00530 [Botryotinia narcissicola]|uniref:Uncharacterized protein n=1 Tax=Botryotinia narcissicola TaxID=278944 RepID=A0A4Z1J7V6_9HELO|nr:hypothetical protein BOTNAR_0008g00530 [Botryotinia narcissicola]